MSRRLNLALLVMVLGVWLAAPALAQVAPQYQSSDPSNGSSVQTAPSSVQITFSEPLDDSSTASITNACGERVGGPTSVSLNEMTVGLPEGHYSGKYTVVYTAVGIGGVTGSTTGQMSFSAAEGHSCGDEPKPPCHHNPDAEECKKNKNPCHHDPNAEGCKKNDDPCHHDPDAAGCEKNDNPCHHDPDAAGCEGDGHNDDHGDDGTGHTDHNDMGTTHTGGHSPGGHSGGHKGSPSGEHGKDHGGHGSRNHASGPIDGEPSSGFFGGEVPDLTTVALALGLCALLGAVGGVFLRVNANA